jgi:hypothetical protein
MMSPIAWLAFQATRELAAGSLFCLALLPAAAIQRGFFRTCVLVLAAAVGVEVWLSPATGSVALLLSLLAYGAALWARDGRWSRVTLGLSLAVAGWAAVGPHLGSAEGLSLSSARAIGVAGTLLSSLLLGSALTGMLLGHAYLRDPHLPVSLIQRLGHLFLAATVLQAAWVAIAVASLYAFGGAAGAATIGLLSSSFGAVVLGRLLIGVLGSFVFACLIWDTLRIPNVQAATGFFYIAILTVMIGEFLGRYLWHSTSIRF